MEKIVVEIDKNSFADMIIAAKEHFGLFLEVNTDYTIKEVKIEDDFFKEDATHKELKSQANKAYKKLREYEYTKRNK